jgi:hypothetical protein
MDAAVHVFDGYRRHFRVAALDRAVRAVRLAEAKLDAAVAEERGDRDAAAEANRRAARIVMHLDEEEDEGEPPTE